MTQPSLISVNLATVGLESLLYGVFLLLSGTSMYLHLNRVASQQSPMRPSSLSMYFTPVILGSTLIILTVSAHWILTIVRLFDAFVNFYDGSEALLYYSDLALTTEIAKTAFLIATLIISDILFIYRLWVVWGYNYYMIIVPVCTVLGLCVAGPGVCYQLSQVSTGNTVFIAQLDRWISADYSFTFSTNVYSSCGIAYRVWTAHRRSGTSYGGGSLMRVLATIVESAAIYTSYTIFFFVSYQAGSNIQYTAVDTLSPIAGIAFMMINVRVGLGWAQNAYPSATGSSSGLTSRRPGEQSFVMRPVAVDISRVVQVDDDMGQHVKTDYTESV